MPRPLLVTARSGRFNVASVSNDASTGGLLIARKMGGRVYRLFNSAKLGGKLIRVKRQPTDSAPIQLQPRQSVDVYITGAIFKVFPDANGDPMRGVYDLLPTSDSRSGRFSLGSPLDPTVKRELIDLSLLPSSAPALAYRLFNSGRNAIQLRTDPASADPLFSLESERSIDFTLAGGETLYICSAAADKPISGMYDLLGR